MPESPPGAQIHGAVLTADGVVIAEETLVFDAAGAGIVSAPADAPGEIGLVLRDASGGTVFEGRLVPQG